MFHDLASRLGYSPLGFGFAGLWFVYTIYFVVMGLLALILNLFGEVEWLKKLQNYDRWGRWNPVDTAIFAWHGWWVTTLITLILVVVIELFAWMNLPGLLHFFPQVGSVVTVIICMILGAILYFDP